MTTQLFHPKYRPDVDGLRAISVLAVVAFHAFPEWIKGGFIGVDVFFVISGYLISTIVFESLDSSTFNFFEFYARRIRRIFPALLLVIFTCYVFGWFTLLADEYKQLGRHIASAAGFVSNLVYWAEAGYFDNSAEVKPLLHLWSLGVEEQFYIAWPFLIWCIWKYKINFFKVAFTLLAASFLLNLYSVERDSVAAFYSPLTRFWELSSGGLLAWFKIYKNDYFDRLMTNANSLLFKAAGGGRYVFSKYKIPSISSFLGLLLLTLGFWVVDKDSIFPGYWALLPVLASVLIIASGPKAYINQVLLSNRILVWIGLISFPLYLWHWPLISIAHIIIGLKLSIGVRVVIIFCSIFLAWFTYFFVERLFRSNIKWFSTWKAQFLFLLLFAIGGVGYATYENDGFYSRKASLVHLTSQLGWNDEKYTENCRELYSPPGSKPEFCRISDNKKVDIVLLGDSKAWQLFHGLNKKANDFGLGVLAVNQGGCSAIFGYSIDLSDKKCFPITRFSLDIAINNPSVKTVIISANPYWIDGGENIFVRSLSSTFEAILAKNKKIILVVNNSNISFDPRLCINRPLRSPQKATCADEVVSYKSASSPDYNKAVETVLTKYPQVSIFDMSSVLCNNGLCWVMQGDNFLFRDSHGHLSDYGSEYVANDLFKLINH